jgi:hypothetical protein
LESAVEVRIDAPHFVHRVFIGRHVAYSRE